MSTSGGQLCARARFWASLRLDGELSELETALLDAHLARCPDCAAYASGSEAAIAALRAAPLELVKPVAVEVHRPGRRAVALVTAAALVGTAAVLGALGDGSRSPHGSQIAGRSVAVVATVETPDQLRRLRRTTLLNARPMPHEISAEPA
jgi:predicted anti-sigma-YlaC factor YlaD